MDWRIAGLGGGERHRGAAVDDALDIDENCVIVLQHAGPVGAPGMPEWGQLPILRKLLQRGVRDMVRISDETGEPEIH